VHDPEITARGSNFRHLVRVEVLLNDGTRMEETVEAPRGSEHSFASEADIVDKFMKLATHAVSREKADRVVNAVLGAERLARAEEIAAALTA
jgi:2-methylcitrate dehydratase PrpD